MDSKSKDRAKIYRCEYCKKEFSAQWRLNYHRKVHFPKLDLKCNFCNYTSNFKPDLFSHIRSHTKERPYKCTQPNCNYAAAAKSTLNRHQLVHNKDDESLLKLKCSKCGYKTGDKGNLNKHLKNHSNIKVFSCDLCPYKTKRENHIKSHHDRVHLKLRRFKCQQPDCDSAFSDSSTLRRHQLVHQKDDDNLLKFKCSKCDYKTPYKGVLKLHLNVHTASTLKPFYCIQPSCNFSCKLKAGLSRHMKVHEDAQPFVCTFEQCTFKTKRKDTLKTHEMTHCEEKPFKCTFCPFKSNYQGSLAVHVRIHTGETPYPCQSCSYRGKTSNALVGHVKRHHLEKESNTTAKKQGKHLKKTCNICGSIRTNLTAHMRTHTGEKPYKCKLCPKSFADQGNLTNHQRFHKNDKLRVYKCSLCPFAARTTRTLQKHSKERHDKASEGELTYY